jgi:ABC-type phosphate transport system substrate-binding protein
MLVVSRLGLLVVGLVAGPEARLAVAEVVAVVSAQNPANTMSKNQVLDIFLGKASRFPDGGAAVPIDQVEGSAVRDEFYLVFAGKSAAQVKAHWSKITFTGRGRPPREVANGEDVKKHLAENPRAIGYIAKNLVDDSVKVVLSQ